MSNICPVVLNSEHMNTKKCQQSFLSDLWSFLDYVFLLPLGKCTAKLAVPIKPKFSGSPKGWIVGLFRKFHHDLTSMADYTGQ